MKALFLIAVSGALVVICVLSLIHALKMIAVNALLKGWNHDILWAMLSTLTAMATLAFAEFIWHLPRIEAGIR